MSLKGAIKSLLEEFHIEDYIYNVRARAAESGDKFEGSSWDHPKVKKFSDILTTLRGFVTEDREDPERTVASIAAMLGWSNVPPRATLERNISALNAQAHELSLIRATVGEFGKTDASTPLFIQVENIVDAYRGNSSSSS